MGVWLLAPTRSPNTNPNPNPNPDPNPNPNSKSDPINANRYANPNPSPSPNANSNPNPHPDQVVKENAWAEQYMAGPSSPCTTVTPLAISIHHPQGLSTLTHVPL